MFCYPPQVIGQDVTLVMVFPWGKVELRITVTFAILGDVISVTFFFVVTFAILGCSTFPFRSHFLYYCHILTLPTRCSNFIGIEPDWEKTGSSSIKPILSSKRKKQHPVTGIELATYRPTERAGVAVQTTTPPQQPVEKWRKKMIYHWVESVSPHPGTKTNRPMLNITADYHMTTRPFFAKKAVTQCGNGKVYLATFVSFDPLDNLSEFHQNCGSGRDPTLIRPYDGRTDGLTDGRTDGRTDKNCLGAESALSS